MNWKAELRHSLTEYFEAAASSLLSSSRGPTPATLLARRLRAALGPRALTDRPSSRASTPSCTRCSVLLTPRSQLLAPVILLPMKRLRIGVLYGGRSGEHEVSLASAAAVFANLDRTSLRAGRHPHREGRTMGARGQAAARDLGRRSHRAVARRGRAADSHRPRGAPRRRVRARRRFSRSSGRLKPRRSRPRRR